MVMMSLVLTNSCNQSKVKYSSGWEYQPDRIWVGPEYWANRLQDWKLEDGKLHCINNSLGLRTVHMLTHHIDSNQNDINIELSFGLNPVAQRKGNDGWAGILVGAGEDQLDYKGSALVHHSPGNAGGLIIAVNENGQVVFLDNTSNREVIGAMQDLPQVAYTDSILLHIEIYLNKDSTFTISASAVDPLTRNRISHNDLTKVPPVRLHGNIAIASNHIEKGLEEPAYWFSKLYIHGKNLKEVYSRRFGPFMGVQHTLSNNILKLTAQLPPIGLEDDHFVRFWIKEKNQQVWKELDSIPVIREGFIAPGRIEGWNSTIDHDYRLGYRIMDNKGRKRTYYYSGTIKADPADKSELVVGAFTGNSLMEGNINGSRCNYPERLWFPHNKFVQSVAAQKPDILFFTGDQVYEGRPTPPDFSAPENTELDYLYKWYIFLWSTGELMRNTPAVCIPDDHDVYHGNIWGAGGKAAPPFPPDSIYPDHYKGFENHWQQDQGGYKLRPSSVNMIQATQTAHLPDPYDPTPVEQDIDVYYTDLNYGRVDFAILEDRKFKSSPTVMLPRAKVINGFAQNRYISGRNLDNPAAKLLGERQLKFLEEWTSDWEGADMKATISQTIFANLSTYPDSFLTDAGTPRLAAPPPGVIPDNYRVAKDMDSNGWPQTGRDKALSVIRKGFATMIAGDQHLGSLVHMGIDTWDDAGYSFCVPAIGNLWPRRWFPQEPGMDHQPGMPPYTGKYYDGFGNRITVWAAANPVETNKEPRALYNRAVGYGIIKFNKEKGQVKFECWRRDANPKKPEEGLFPGWPKTISAFENYNRPVRSWLPYYEIQGLAHYPVFQIINEDNGEVVYSIRIPGSRFQPGVFSYGGTYTVRIGDPDTGKMKELTNVSASYYRNEDPVIIKF